MNRFSRAWDNKNARIVHIRELPKETRNGKKCDCICVEANCKGALEACQGEVNEWFFRHQSTTTCKGGPMTALHILAQELLVGNQTIKTREGEESYTGGEKEWIIIGSRYEADIVGIKPDGSRFLIEIFVTHRLSEEENKVKHIREQKIHSIEIDLSDIDPDIPKVELLNLILTDFSKQKIIYSPNEALTKAEQVVLVDSRKQSWFDKILQWVIFSGIIYCGYKLLTRKKSRRK